ncbi:MAG: glycogen-binding domain-containing protein, partial [Phycisphaeraceae bacterium]|nr:glycogen-binding domain-containing protein [Phycisphaeraceae bacterium]
SFGQPISEYDPHCRGHEDFVQLAKHLIEHETVEQAEAVLAEAESNESAQATAAPTSASADVEPVTDPDGHANRAAELVQRAKALAQRTAKLQSQLAVDPDIARMDAEGDRPTDDHAARQQLEHRLQTLYGVRVTRQGTLFVQPDADGVGKLSIAGDFNDWSHQATPMHRNDRLGIWEVCVPLAPGRYRYRLLVDGQWTSDPHNTYVETNPFGELNNIVEVGAELASN